MDEQMRKLVKWRLSGHSLRARQLGLIDTLTVDEWVTILEASGGKCHYCEKKLDPLALVVDHVIPMAKGGPNSADNVVPACASCNSSKNDLDLPKFLRIPGFTPREVKPRRQNSRHTKPVLVHARLTDSEYASFRAYVEAHPELEDNESMALRRLIRTLTAAPPAAPKRKDAK